MDEPTVSGPRFTEGVTDTDLRYEELPVRVRRRLAVTSLLRSVLVSVAIVVGYFVLPMSRLSGASGVGLVIGLVVVALLLGWQLRAITRSPYPRIRAIGALVTSVPLFLVIFATTYHLMGANQPGSFSEPMDRLDAAYFTVTVFATVGFGDIVATSQAARTVVTVQMIGNLVMVGLVARALFGAVQTNISHRKV
jgi:voltage-gated potassium channel